MPLSEALLSYIVHKFVGPDESVVLSAHLNHFDKCITVKSIIIFF